MLGPVARPLFSHLSGGLRRQRLVFPRPLHRPAMPPQLLFDISTIDLNHVAYDQEAIRESNPQRGDMEHLNAIVYVEPSLGRVIGYKDVRDDEFWVPGHIPGRPLLPG